MKIGIIGASFARDAYLPALRLFDDVEVLAVASARLSSAQEVATQFGVRSAYDDWRRMLQENSFDLVCIATPTVTHAPMVLAALEAGAHVLSEKPTAMNAAEAELMLHRAESLGRIHMIDHELRFNAKRKHVKKLIDDGSLGAIRHVAITSIGASWGDPASRPKDDWWSLESQGGGRLGANGSHQVDLLRWWFGEIKAVSGQVKTVVRERTGKGSGRPWTATADDFVQFNAELAGGGLATVLLSTVARHGLGSETHICGSDGTISLSSDTEKLLYAQAGATLTELEVIDPYASLPGLLPGIWNQSVVGVIREIHDAIKEKHPIQQGATFLDGLRNQQVLDAIRKSEADRRWVSLSA